MAMTTNNEVKEANKEMIAANNNAIEAATNNQETEVVEVKEKKKINWRGIGRKVLIGAGAAAGAVGVFLAGFGTGRVTAKKSDDPELPDVTVREEDGVTITEF